MTCPGSLLELSSPWVSNPKSWRLLGPTSGNVSRPSFYWALRIPFILISMTSPWKHEREGKRCILWTKFSWHHRFRSHFSTWSYEDQQVSTHPSLVSRLIFTSDEHVLRVGPREAVKSDPFRQLTPKVLGTQLERKQSSLKHCSPRCHTGLCTIVTMRTSLVNWVFS